MEPLTFEHNNPLTLNTVAPPPGGRGLFGTKIAAAIFSPDNAELFMDRSFTSSCLTSNPRLWRHVIVVSVFLWRRCQEADYETAGQGQARDKGESFDFSMELL